jgi:hypothetical protein
MHHGHYCASLRASTGALELKCERGSKKANSEETRRRGELPITHEEVWARGNARRSVRMSEWNEARQEAHQVKRAGYWHEVEKHVVEMRRYGIEDLVIKEFQDNHKKKSVMEEGSDEEIESSLADSAASIGPRNETLLTDQSTEQDTRFTSITTVNAIAPDNSALSILANLKTSDAASSPGKTWICADCTRVFDSKSGHWYHRAAVSRCSARVAGQISTAHGKRKRLV